jgi:2-polyprenyl-3-methyl-5-hydroxy-6-metoxy-1,4-benzoquinol methylase
MAKDDWNQHWNSYAAAAALNPAAAYRRDLVFELLSLRDAKAPVRLLDLGCGTGEFASDVLRARPDAEVLGLELSASGVEMARRKVPSGRFFEQDFTSPLALPATYHGWATHAVCSEVLEHLDDPATMLRNVRPLFAPGCRLIVTVPSGPMSDFDRHIGHRRHFSRRLLASTLREAGLDVVDLRGAGFPFFNLYRLVVVARGKKVITDVVSSDAAGLPWSARSAMRAFSWLFRLNSSKTALGWQLAALAAEP